MVMEKNIFSILFVSFSYLIFLFLFVILENFSPESVEIIKRIPIFMGGASAIYFLFQARSSFSKRMTLYSFLLSSCYLFVLNHVHVTDIAILVVCCVCFSFFFSYYFVSEEISLDKHLETIFFLLFASRFFMSPEMVQWGISLLLELIFLFGFYYIEEEEKNQKRKWVFFSITLFFLLPLFYIFSSWVIQDIHFEVVLVLAAAGAGGIHFMCLSKTERGQTLSLLFYIINNVILGFILRKEAETFPKITIFFLIFILCLFISLWLLSKIRNESFFSVLSESKTTLRGLFFPALFLLNSLFFQDSYVDLKHWITSFSIQILVLLLLKFVLKKEDEDPGRGSGRRE